MSIFKRKKVRDEFDEEYLDKDGFWEDESLNQRQKLKQERREKKLRRKAEKEEAKREELRGREVSAQEKNDISKEENVDLKLDEEIKKDMSKEELLNMVENSCDQMMTCQKHLENIKKEYREINNYLSDIEKIERLEEPLKKELETEVRRIKNLSEDKNNYKHAAAKMSETKFELIESREKEMPKIMRELKNDEDHIQSIKTDMHHLEGEKHALIYERQMYLDHMNLIRKIFIAVILLAIILLTGFTIGQINGTYDYTIGYYIVTVLTLIALAIILVTRQNEERELKLTELKLNKAIGLLNRYKLRYVNLRSSIDYTYQMYGVSNSYELNALWGKYITAKKEREAYFTMSENLYKANSRFLEIIESIGLYDTSVWNYQMYAIIDGEEMMVIKNTLLNRKESVRNNMDYNSNIIRNSKDKIKKIIAEHPELAESVLALVERKEKELEKEVD